MADKFSIRKTIIKLEQTVFATFNICFMIVKMS